MIGYQGLFAATQQMHVTASMGYLDTALEAFDKSADKGSPRAPSPTLPDKKIVMAHPKDYTRQAYFCSLPTRED